LTGSPEVCPRRPSGRRGPALSLIPAGEVALRLARMGTEGSPHGVAAEPQPPPDGGETVPLAAQLQDLRQPGGGWPGRLPCDTLALQQARHLLAADARRAGNAAGAVTLSVEIQHSCPQLGVLGTVGQILHLAELPPHRVDLVGGEGPDKEPGDDTFVMDGAPRPGSCPNCPASRISDPGRCLATAVPHPPDMAGANGCAHPGPPPVHAAPESAPGNMAADMACPQAWPQRAGAAAGLVGAGHDAPNRCRATAACRQARQSARACPVPPGGPHRRGARARASAAGPFGPSSPRRTLPAHTPAHTPMAQPACDHMRPPATRGRGFPVPGGAHGGCRRPRRERGFRRKRGSCREQRSGEGGIPGRLRSRQNLENRLMHKF
jgi:hypothetical protein